MMDIAKKDEHTPIKRPDSEACRKKIFALENWLLEQPQADVKTIHRFAPGVYTREMQVPAGVMLTGAIHKTEHISIFLEGRMVVNDGEGNAVEIEAPIVERAMPGIKRAGVALTDVRWITVHPTELKDIDEIERTHFTNDPDEVPAIIKASQGAIIAPETEDEI